VRGPSKWTLSDPYGLNFQERRVLEMLRVGKGTREIANVLGVSTRTVHTYYVRIYRKTDTHHRCECLAKVAPWSPDMDLEDEIDAVAERSGS